MFIQVIEGRTNDAEALHERMEVWNRDLRPGAVGFLGSTAGVTADGDVVLIARFESREAAERNSNRPQQGEWWAATERCFDGPVAFHDSEEVEVMAHGDPDGAHFVQVMDGHVSDHDRAVALERDADAMLAELRPELLAAVLAFHDGDAFTEVAYFTSEDDARRGEQIDMPADAAAMIEEWRRLMPVDRYYDIRDPWLTTA